MSAPDERAELARRYLAEISARSVEVLPPSRLMAECAELRRLLGQVLAVLDSAPVLTGPQRALVLEALDEAAGVRQLRAAAWCDACATAPDGACDYHVEDLDTAEDYQRVAREIGGPR